MSETSFTSQTLGYLRLPRFEPTDRRKPVHALLHGLPPFLMLSLNLWMVGLGLCGFIAAYFSLPSSVMMAMMAVIALPCAFASWAFFVQCVEVEATLED